MSTSASFRRRDCVAIGENSFKIVIPAKAGIQNLLKILDSPVSSTGQALRRALLEFIRRMLDGMTKMVIATQSRKPESSVFWMPDTLKGTRQVRHDKIIMRQSLCAITKN
ncbi:MAG: hypothetical protein A2W27_01835 [Deltaproteobacteria bacterium RBG_16_44_11]|nr:MAG: hypothetical protein A2W27_01835 [Deltaproteobacteria bacterium RBG_16_44_11]